MLTSETASHLLHIDFNILLQVVAVQIQHKVMHKVKTVTDDYQWQLICQFGLLKKKKSKKK